MSQAASCAVRKEIWESFVSLLRSYAGGAGVNGKTYTVHWSSEEVVVEHQGESLRFSFLPESGEGTWCDGEGSGSFLVNEDGTFGFAEGMKAIDIAAIDWIEQLAQGQVVKGG